MNSQIDIMPRYAGLTHVKKTGLSVEEAGNSIRRLAYAEERMMRFYASRVILFKEREIKLLFARFQYESAQHADLLRQRAQEMRLSKNKLNTSPDEALSILFNEAEFLPAETHFLTSLTDVILPSLIGSYQEYLTQTNHLADYPTVRIIRQNLMETEEHLDLIKQAAHALPPIASQQTESEMWRAHLQEYLIAAGGLLGKNKSKKQLEPKYSTSAFEVPHTLQRDSSFTRVWDFEKPSKEDTDAYLRYMMAIRLSEINVSEGLGFVLLETPNMPWSFYLDISRHMWDEMRHSMFGEAAIEAAYGRKDALPQRDYEAIYAFSAPPLEQYATLGLEIEGANMKYPPGKRWEWEFSRDQAKDPLMTTFQDFDWADEVLHVNIARRQLDSWFEGGLKEIVPYSKAGKKNRDEIKAQQPKTKLEEPK